MWKRLPINQAPLNKWIRTLDSQPAEIGGWLDKRPKDEALMACEDCVQEDDTKDEPIWTHNILIRHCRGQSYIQKPKPGFFSSSVRHV